MKRRLIQSYYLIELEPIEMGKIHKMRSPGRIAQKILNIRQVKGTIFSSDGIEVNIKGENSEAIVGKVEEIIKEELI